MPPAVGNKLDDAFFDAAGDDDDDCFPSSSAPVTTRSPSFRSPFTICVTLPSVIPSMTGTNCGTPSCKTVIERPAVFALAFAFGVALGAAAAAAFDDDDAPLAGEMTREGVEVGRGAGEPRQAHHRQAGAVVGAVVAGMQRQAVDALERAVGKGCAGHQCA